MFFTFAKVFRGFPPDVVHFWSTRNQQKKSKQLGMGTVGDWRGSGAGVRGGLVLRWVLMQVTGKRLVDESF